jgi:NAD(P)-dependent dehydrogenase (short-subunit alcohol dehydrogenase family)
MNFEGRTVLITGAAGQLGQAVVAAFAAQGARLALVDRQTAGLKAGFGGKPDIALIDADLLDGPQVAAAVAAATTRFGRIHVLCHLAGGFRMGQAVHETDAATWDLLFDLNARSFVNIGRELVPHMLDNGGGRIVAVGAYAARQGTANMGAYIASKSSLIRLVESMSAELKSQHINVNCVLPTIIDTPANRASMPDADPAAWVAPQALAEVILFLASDAARAVHGAALPVTGLS